MYMEALYNSYKLFPRLSKTFVMVSSAEHNIYLTYK